MMIAIHRACLVVLTFIALSLAGYSTHTYAAPDCSSGTSSIWPTDPTPLVLADPDSVSIEVGVKFRSDIDGFICGVRFYKDVANIGPHVGTLWSSTGQALGSVTFTNETASGWQRMDFPVPIAVTANEVYTASYLAPVGKYSINAGFFATAGVTNGPLHAFSEIESLGNGVFRYGTGGVFPTDSFNSSNYWVDVVFAEDSGPCSPGSNPIVCENSFPGNPPSEWDITGAGDPSIQGFATDISVNHGDTIGFKINTVSSDYRLDIYRMGYYGGDGARLMATVEPSASLPQFQPPCLTDGTGLVDCGNWAESASWTVPPAGLGAQDATSGVYFAKVVREDGADAGKASHIVFVVRDDASTSEILLQTSDTTWQAYNNYGGNNLYQGTGPGAGLSGIGRAYKVSYNRPFMNRDVAAGQEWFFNAEYPMVRWLEANGYDVSYFTGVDSDRNGALITNHRVFLSVGHDEYWSGGQRNNVEDARDAGVNLGFLGGNNVFWKTRWEDSIDGSGSPHRTLVCYKETHEGAKIDPSSEWTGTWRDPRFGPHDGGRPENELTGVIFGVNNGSPASTGSITVPEEDGNLRFWRNTSVAALAPGEEATLPSGTLGFEWDVVDLNSGFILDNEVRPAGLVELSSTTVENAPVLTDFGSTFGSEQATHALTLYRDIVGGSLVFAAGTIQWSWGLDDNHDRGGTPTSPDMQQATVNLFADMGVQPVTLQPGLVPGAASTDSAAPVSTILDPLDGASVPQSSVITISGTAVDTGGQVGSVEVSVDGGTTWSPATGRSLWNYDWITPGTATTVTIMSRATDDSLNTEVPGAGNNVSVAGTDTTAPTVIGQTPADGALEVSINTAVTVTFSEAMRAGSIDSTTFELRDGATLVGATVSSAGTSATLTPTAPLRTGAVYTVTVKGGAGGVEDSSGNPLAADVTWQFTTVTAGSADCSTVTTIWPPTETPALAADPDTGEVELGVKFNADVDGFICGIRFYKSITNTGTHVGNLWDAAGNNLGSATFVSETASGWQQVNFATPIPITAGTTYIASYHAPNGQYSIDVGYFAGAQQDNPPLHALEDVASGGNGVYLPGPGGFPNLTFQSSNYWVDVTFTSTTFNDTTPPTVISFTPADGATDVDPATTVTVDFSEPMDPATVNDTTVQLTGPLGQVTASVIYAGNTATLTPGAALDFNTQYTVTVVGGASGVADVAGNSLAVDATAQFTTSLAPDTTPPTVTSITPTDGSLGIDPGTAITVVFSEDMAPATVNAGTVLLADPSGPVAATLSLVGNTATLTPGAALDFNTQYTVTVLSGASGVQDLAGNPLVVDATSQFTTSLAPDTTAPTVTTVTPADTTTGVDIGTTVTAVFSEPMDPATVTATTVLLTGPLVPVTATVSYVGNTATLTPGAPLDFDTQYTATVLSGASGAADLAGNPLASDVTWQFTTATAPPSGQSATYRLTFTGTWNANDVSTAFPGSAHFTNLYGATHQAGSSLWTPGATASTGIEDVAEEGNPAALMAEVNTAITAGTAESFIQVNELNSFPSSSEVIFNVSADKSEISLISMVAPSPDWFVGVSGLSLRDQNGWIDDLTVDLRPWDAGTEDGNGFSLGNPATVPQSVIARPAAESPFIGSPVIGQLQFELVSVSSCAGGTTIWPATTTPGTIEANDSTAYELGVKFNADSDGFICGIRFYKSLANVGPHIGNLWDSAGNNLGTALFTNETADGWQQVDFPNPIPVTAGVTYIASYHTTVGRYSVDLGYFSGFQQDNPPLHALESGASGGNGVFVPSATSAFPNSSAADANYWVDVVFTESVGPDTTPPTVTTVTPADGSTGVNPTTATATATFSEALDPATVGPATALLDGPSGPVTVAVSYAANVITITPNAPLAPNTSYTATVRGGATGVTDAAGNALALDQSWQFTTAGTGTADCGAGTTIWAPTTIPGLIDANDTAAYELGVKFNADEDGFICGVRFYKSVANTGTHIGNLWDTAGNNLATAVFSNETADGWQEVTFPNPVAVTAGVTYIASYHTTVGRYSFDGNFFTGVQVDNPPLHALESGASGGNGVFVNSPVSGFPTTTVADANYWVDVVFTSTTISDTTPPTVNSFTPADGATGVNPATAITVDFSEPMDPATVNDTTVLLTSQLGQVTATVIYVGNSATLTPGAVLDFNTQYTVTVVGGPGGAADVAGNTLAADATAQFTTSLAPDTTPPTVTSITPTDGSLGIDPGTTVTVVFSEDMDPATVNTGTVLLADPIGPVAATLSLVGNSATLTPNAALDFDTQYTVTVLSGASGVQDLAGNPLAVDATSQFTTSLAPDTTAPTVTTVTPADTATDVNTGTTVAAVFSEPMDPATVTDSTVLLTGPLGPVTASVSYIGNTATLTPGAPLDFDTQYTATVSGGASGAADLAGNPLASDVTWQFTTAPEATIDCNSGTTIWPATATPSLTADPASTPVELGVKFIADVDGVICGIRFFKGLTNTGTHVGNLWDAAGNNLASATFVGESPTGWQQVNFAVPVPVTANVTYIASYHAPQGQYSIDVGYFAGFQQDNPPLHALEDVISGGNGVYLPGAGGFPVNTFQASNYWVDVVFAPTSGGDTTAPTVTTVTPADGSTAVDPATTVTAVFNEPLDPATVTAATFNLIGPSGSITATVSYTGNTATLVPVSALATETTYTATVTGGAAGVTDLAGNPLAADTTWQFTTAPPLTAECATGTTIWPATTTPGVTSDPASSPVELGVKFSADVDGVICGIRFFKGLTNTGTHVGNLWDAAGNNLASATFVGETATGWQQVNFAVPVPITANATYIASYHAPLGQYSIDVGYFAGFQQDNPPLHALEDVISGGNGVFLPGAGGFPANTFQASNYWVDVVFAPTSGSDTTAPTVTTFTPADGSTGIDPATTVTAVFNEPLDPATVTSATFDLVGPTGSIAATVSYAGNTATLVPDSALATETTYTATVTGGAAGVTDLAGNPLAADTTWQFTTAPPLTAECATGTTIWPATTTPSVTSDPASSPVELGVKFSADVDGVICGIRFFKGLTNTGTHVGNLWDAAGNNLASATFVGETPTGWQQVNFAVPVPITANATYIASYHAPQGRYSIDVGYFDGFQEDNPPLHALEDVISGGNGVFLPGAGGFPINTFQASNYWVDVVFAATSSDTTAPTVTTIVPADGSTGIDPATAVTVLFSEPMDPATVSGTTVQLTGPGGAVAAAVTYAADTATITPAAALAFNTLYTVTVTGGASGVTDLAGNPLVTDAISQFTTSLAPDTIAPTVTTLTPADGSTGVDPATTVTAVFSEPMDAATVNGTTVQLAGPGGAVAAAVTYAGNTATLAPAAALAFNTLYTVTVTGGASGVTDLAGNPLVTDATSQFTTSLAPDTIAPTVTTVTPADGSTGVDPATTVTAVFSEPMDPATVNGTTVQLAGPGGAVAAAVTYAGNTATLTPAAALAFNTLYTVTVTGGALGVADLAGNPLAIDRVWQFTTRDNVSIVLIDANFDAGAEGFGYADDAFRGTAEPAYASGTHLAAGGFTGGGLQVTVGGVDDADINEMSGGWQRTFTLAVPTSITVSLRYNLSQTPHYEGDEASEALLSIDGVEQVMAEIVGDGEEGPVMTTGWQLFTTDLGVLPAGDHTITVGGFNSKKTFNNESTEILIDDVLVSTPPAP